MNPTSFVIHEYDNVTTRTTTAKHLRTMTTRPIPPLGSAPERWKYVLIVIVMICL